MPSILHGDIDHTNLFCILDMSTHGQAEESMDKAWQGAEAYHLWLLGQRQLLRGDYDSALRTALNTRRYTDILDARNVYMFLLLAALCAGYLGVAAKALMKLESMEEVPTADRSNLTALATAIFVNQVPQVRCGLMLSNTHFTGIPRYRNRQGACRTLRTLMRSTGLCQPQIQSIC